MTSPRVELPEQDAKPPEWLDSVPSNTTWTDPHANEDLVLPIVAAVYQHAVMEEGYREMGRFDSMWAETDLPATLGVLPAE